MSIELNQSGLLLIVSGPSGTGKGTICQKLIEQHPEIKLSVSMTTRAPRKGEIEGVSYFYKTEEEFLAIRDAGGLLEYARVYDSYYGTPLDYVQDQLKRGNDLILEIDMQGALKVKEKMPEALLLFVAPPSLEVLRERITGRGTETPEAIEKRMGSVYREMEYLKHYDYVLINHCSDDTAVTVEQIINAEKCRVSRNRHIEQELLNEEK